MKYSRILLKLSGESLSEKGNHGINASVLEEYAKQVIEVVKKGCEVAIVIGGGNIFRGQRGTESGFDRVMEVMNNSTVCILSFEKDPGRWCLCLRSGNLNKLIDGERIGTIVSN